ncbi:transglutaminase-like enzymes, putative cysteine proteases [Filimonas lacunae]|nr:transglutaminase-like enzymes, putative cysteine proteases [Filimonas lacunae]
MAQLLLLAVPTVILMAYLLWNLNRYEDILRNNWEKQSLYFAGGIAGAIILYSYRFRFITTAAVLFVVGYATYTYMGSITVGEFDAFFVSVQFLIFSILFSIGWICGFGFSRSRYFTVFWSVFLLAIQIVTISKTNDITARAIIAAFLPTLAYAVYIIYTAELIRNMNPSERHFGWFVTKRMVGFGIVMAVLFFAVLKAFDKDFKAVEKEWGHGEGKYDKNKSNQESMTKDNRDGTISNKDQTQLTGSLNKGKRLVFVAKLDNFFEDGKTPNPLYFTAYYYTRFDTLTQTFEMDNKMPDNDLFRPDPSKIPIYFAKTDSSVIKNTHATKARKVVTAEIYKTLLSPSDFVAPSTAFFCQPLPVEADYKDKYKSAYRAKMWVSDLNSAYFIYNPAGNQMLESFQEQRFKTLRQVTDYTSIPDSFMKYYTFMPQDAEYGRIKTLAGQITQGAATPLDKMVAIRDYFTGKDEFGQPLFKYENNPGIPGMPSANKLTYFLFENRKGYCAYYAGATLFMLRAMGIPSRIATGFLTVDRSSKNPGWYWFYEDQAHAWVQVYFPGYGWIDFDTTIPDQEAHDADQPDETPPLSMQQAYMVADGHIVSVDSTTKKLVMTVDKLLFHDQNYETTRPDTLSVDGAIAQVSADSGVVPFSALRKDMHITAASSAEVLKDMTATPVETIKDVLKRVPKPAPTDQIKIIEDEATTPPHKNMFENIEPVNWLKVLATVLIVAAALLVLVFAMPWIIWQVLHMRAKGNKPASNKAYNQYRAAMYYLNQLGYARNHKSPGEYAAQTDAQFGTRFIVFSNVYQKLKYSSLPFTTQEEAVVQEFYKPFIASVRKQVPLRKRAAKFLNIYNTIHYFTQPK